MITAKKKWFQFRRRLAQIIEVARVDDPVSKLYGLVSTLILLLNVSVTVMYTFDEMEIQYGELLLFLEAITIAFLQLTMFSDSWQHSLSIPPCRNMRH